jgi:hypothetical protein
MKNIANKDWRGNQVSRFRFNKYFPPKIVRFLDNDGKYGAA